MPSRNVRTPRNLAELVLDDRNANLGTARGRELLGKSLQELGAGRSIVIDRARRVIAGNKTVEQARVLNLPIQVVKSDGRTLFVLQRTDLDLHKNPKARELALADNRTSEEGLKWDTDVLEQLRTEGFNTEGWWTKKEWASSMGSELIPAPGEDRVLAPGPTRIKRGDLFALSHHRLLCGDATDEADVLRLLVDRLPFLMATDPPYGVSYDAAWRHRAFPAQRTAIGAVANDSQVAWDQAIKHFHGCVAYVWHAARSTATVASTLDSLGFDLRAQIIWTKPSFVLSRGDYHWQHEPCWYAVRRGRKANWQGDRTQTTVWAVPNLGAIGGSRTAENTPTGHSTQKPVRLFEIPILNHTRPGDAVYDPFVGSGTTIIAAEKTERTAYVMDLDPQYVQVAVNRWEQFAGKRAIRIAQAASTRRRS